MDKQQETAGINSDKRNYIPVMLVFFVVTCLLYAKAVGHGFIINWDDDKYIINNLDIQGIGVANFKLLFSRQYVGNYAPVHLMSYMLDYQIWGLNPAGYHFESILWHAVNGFLVYRLLLKLDIAFVPAMFGASLFTLHPVQVESVAWVAERKNVLSAFFFLLAFITYIDYRKAEIGGLRSYIFSLILFTLALLSKSITVIFPFVILCYDYCFTHIRGRFKLVDKMPFFLLALVAGVMAVYTQNKGNNISMSDFPGGSPLNALWTMMPVFVSYLKDLFYPFDLSPYYMVKIRKTVDLTAVLSAVFLFCLALFGVLSIKRWPRLFFFISLFVLSLLPIMQIIPLISTLKNDRYLYFPMIGVSGVAGMLLTQLMQISARIRNLTVVVTVTVCMVLGYTTYYQALIWKDNITLWRYALKKDRDNMLAWLMLAKGYTKMGNSREAVTAIRTFYALESKQGPLRGCWEGEW